jgi:adenylate cyclase class IV
MIGQLNKSIKEIEATTISSENYVLQTLRVALTLALDIKKEELNYFNSKTIVC